MPEMALVTIPKEQVERASVLAGLVIKSADAEQTAISGLTFVQSVIRNLEKARKELVTPLNDEVKKVNTSFKLLNEPFELAETRLKDGIKGWRAEESKRIADEQVRILRENQERERLANEAALKAQADLEAKALAEAAEANLTPEETKDWVAERAEVVPEVPVLLEQLPLEQKTTVTGTIGGYTARMVWKFKVVDATQVPRAYMVVDESRIRTSVNAGVREIPGVDIYSEEQISGRRNR